MVLGSLIAFDELPEGFTTAAEVWWNRDGYSARQVMLMEDQGDDPTVIVVGVLQLSEVSFTPGAHQAELPARFDIDTTMTAADVDGRVVYHDAGRNDWGILTVVEQLNDRSQFIMSIYPRSAMGSAEPGGASSITLEDAFTVYRTVRVDLDAADCFPADAAHLSCAEGPVELLWVDPSELPYHPLGATPAG